MDQCGGRHRAGEVGHDADVVRLAQGGNLEHFGDSAGPVNVRLEYVDCLRVHERLETPAGVLVFSTRDRHTDLAADCGIAFDFVRQDWLFQPPRFVLLEPLRHLDRVGHIPAHPAIEHHVDAVANSTA